MLKLIREHANSWLIKSILWMVVAAFLGTIFYSWGMGENAARSDEVARVFDEKISYKEYSDALDKLYNFYRNNFKGRNVEGLIQRSQLKRTALNTVIQRKLLLNEAREMGIKATDQDVIDKIRSLSAFQNEGRFDNTRYLDFLQYNRITAKKFENNQRIDLILTKTESLIRDSVKVSELELRDAYKWKHEKINLDYLLIKPDFFKGKENLTDKKISEFYKKEIEKFRKPDQIKIEYLFADPVLFEKSAKIDEQEIETYYSDHQDEYREIEMRRASHILIRKIPTAALSEETLSGEQKDMKEKLEKKNFEAKKKAEDLLAQLKEGADFEKLAIEFSEDKGTAAKGGDLDFFTRGKMLKEFEDAAFSLEIDELSEIVETVFGYHIIKATDQKEARTKPLNEVKDEINEKLIEKRSKKLARRSLSKILKNERPIKEFAKERSSSPVKKGITDFFSVKDKEIPTIGTSSQFKLEAFSLKENEVSSIVKTDKGIYLLRLLEKKESYIKKLDEVKDEVIKSLSLIEQEKLAGEEAHRLQDKLKNGTSMDELAGQTDIEVSHTLFFDRDEAANKFGMKRTFIDTAFKLKENESAVVPVSGRYYLVLMLERAGFDEESYEKEKDGFLKTILEDKQSKVLTAWMANLRKNAEITINEQLL